MVYQKEIGQKWTDENAEWNDDYTSMAKSITSTFCRRYNLWTEYEDVLSVIFLEIIKLLPKYDSSKGTEFSTFFLFHIKNHKPLERIILGETLPVIKIPESKRSLISDIKKHGENNISEIALDRQIPEFELYKIICCTYVDSIDRTSVRNPKNDSNIALVDILYDGSNTPEEIVEKEMLIDNLYDAVEKLSAVDKRIIKARYFNENPISYEKIGLELSRCRQWVCKREHMILKSLHDELCSKEVLNR